MRRAKKREGDYLRGGLKNRGGLKSRQVSNDNFGKFLGDFAGAFRQIQTVKSVSSQRINFKPVTDHIYISFNTCRICLTKIENT